MKLRPVYFFPGLIIILGLSSCTTTRKYYEVVEFKPGKTESSPATVENEDVRVSYNAWSNGGLFTFKVYNKTDSGLIINWQNSSLVIDSMAVNYNGNGKVSLNSLTTARVYNNTANSYYRYNTISTTQSLNYENPPDITFIPPGTYAESSVYKVNKHFHNPQDDIHKKSDIKTYQYTSYNTPFQFRNIISYAAAATPGQLKTIEVPLWVSEVSVMGEDQFVNYNYDSNGYATGEPIYPKKKNNAYYNETVDSHLNAFGVIMCSVMVGVIVILAGQH